MILSPSQKRLIFRHFSPFSLRSSCYAPSKTQKMTENQPVSDRDPEQALGDTVLKTKRLKEKVH
jgi:hypothetical protein